METMVCPATNESNGDLKQRNIISNGNGTTHKPTNGHVPTKVRNHLKYNKFLCTFFFLFRFASIGRCVRERQMPWNLIWWYRFSNTNTASCFQNFFKIIFRRLFIQCINIFVCIRLLLYFIYLFFFIWFVQHIPATWTWNDLNWKNVWFFAYLHAGSIYALYIILTGQAKLLTVLFGKWERYTNTFIFMYYFLHGTEWKWMEERRREKKKSDVFACMCECECECDCVCVPKYAEQCVFVSSLARYIDERDEQYIFTFSSVIISHNVSWSCHAIDFKSYKNHTSR